MPAPLGSGPAFESPPEGAAPEQPPFLDDPFTASSQPSAEPEPWPPTEPQRLEFVRDSGPLMPEEPLADRPLMWEGSEARDEFVVAAGSGGGGGFSFGRRGSRTPRGPRNMNVQRVILIAALGLVIIAAIIILVFMGGEEEEPIAQPTFTVAPTPASTARSTPAATATPASTPIPGLVDKNCSDFDNQLEAQNFFTEAGGPHQDLHGLDPDNDGTACEDLATPSPAATAATATPGTTAVS